MWLKKFGILFIFLLNSITINAQTHAYCYSKKNITEQRVVQKERIKTVKYKAWGIFPRTKQMPEIYNETVTIPKTVSFRHCCEGYQLHTDTHSCLPICEPKCAAESFCLSPNYCQEQTDINQSSSAASTEDAYEETTTDLTITNELSLNATVTDSFQLNLPHDCKRTPCPAHANCLDNGTCVCQAEYEWHEVTTQQQLNDEILVQQNYCLRRNEALPNDLMSYLLNAVVMGVVLAIIIICILWFCVRYNKKTTAIINSSATCKYVIKDEESCAFANIKTK